MNTSQLLRLKIKNYRSFNGMQEIDFRSRHETRKITAFYGPNASGKSNIVKALQFIQWFIINSNNTNLIKIPTEPFMLNAQSRLQPSEFEIEFKQDSRHFIYGFSVDADSVKTEYLSEFASNTMKPRTIFKRTLGGLNATAEKYKFGKKLFTDTRPTVLLITKARENNNEYSNLLFKWLTGINVLSGNPSETIQWTVDQLRAHPDMQKEVTDLLGEADLWIRSFNVENITLPLDVVKQLPLSEDTKSTLTQNSNNAFTIKTTHTIRDKNKKVVGEQVFDLATNESSGTRKFFELAAPIVDTLAHGKLLYLDEFGAYLHSDICIFIVSLFKSSRNKHGAQLIINTHDTALMRDALLAREDIFFVEKNFSEESIITPLSDKSVRLGESFEKRYRQGLYGAKPQVIER